MCGIKKEIYFYDLVLFDIVLAAIMSGVTIVLTVLAILFTDHCVWTLDYYDDVELSVSNQHIDPMTASGKSYPIGRVENLPNTCCVVIKGSDTGCDYVPIFRSGCECTVVYQSLTCSPKNYKWFSKAVDRKGGTAVVFTIRRDEDQNEREIYNFTKEELRIPVIFAENSGSSRITTLDKSGNLTISIVVNPPDDDPTNNGFANARSATTFYFVVFAFTILLLLSLTWFVFNYLRRCHHMYTVKRQRVS